ncbi:CPXCG motif-containing cysteine-rich protein [Spiribacter vilamensis]|uniref:Cysteine-rich CPXCG protein n=1 Tax=Spiribacter vilamensis TaxID=531306 RepID=A0A4Q8D1N9_9GAMM|nr:CPXCG motif-containing cysteine-rich protein [Spiribacter vilamensis]RZU99258.1 cysteine-rich CPXCG protein [Spiribacter vilamensis]TVO61757.1 CPXCG motif-containing cysteine-rich protein [Spiribacter vilamensis]
MIENVTIECPYCGEAFTTVVDYSAGDQDYIEDCVVCCRPIECRLTVTADGPQLTVRRDDD